MAAAANRLNRWERCNFSISATRPLCDKELRVNDKRWPKMSGTKTSGTTASGTWNTKYGRRRVRQDPPTLDDAIAAARGLTDDLQAQIEIAASLMDLPADQVRAEVLKSATPRKNVNRLALTGRGGMQRTVIVERKTPRRPLGKTLLGS